ncbi:MAG: aspartate aminotransferase family protein [SAR324 cluster bacterium]|nr:aspartate aminotransferase family protein [SAR324 cluster bacterium]
MKEYDLQSAIEADKHLIHPLHHPSTHENPKIWVSAKGSILTDIEGKEYLDGLSGLWNVNVGHGRKELADAAAAQMSQLAYASAYTGSSNLRAIELAERLADITYQGINAFFFTSGGGESNESAFKTARFFWKSQGKPDKVKIISRELGYHGVTMATMSATGLTAYWPMFEPRVPNFLLIPGPYPYYFDGGDENTPQGVAAANFLEEAILREGPETVAAFIAEPVQGAGGVIVPQDEYFPRIREICTQYDVLFIADEVITGFCRTGSWFALDRWGVEPDILSFAKGITSGYIPLGGIGLSDRIRDAIMDAEPGKRWMHAYTYSGHPTACAVGLANLDIMEREDLVTRAAENGAHLINQLKSLESHPNVGEVRGLGMMAAVELVEDKATRKNFDRSRKIGETVSAVAIEKGLFSRAREDVYCLAPPLTTSRSELERIVDCTGEAIRAVLGG